MSIEDNPILIACLIIEYMVYYRGNTRRVLDMIQTPYLEKIKAILEKNFIKGDERLEFANQIINEKNAEISKIYLEIQACKNQIYSLESEKERLEKLTSRQTVVLRTLQDRLDGVNNSGQ
ncbi:MAG: hypothetical protein JEZ00_20390 [Anaerolineaceae bacterium]|nr:hypothetical protein [Anaerolineaceae bacterium]